MFVVLRKLFVFLGRALSLPGSDAGVEEYIRDSNWGVFSEKPDVWAKGWFDSYIIMLFDELHNYTIA
jgi:hypothetical protein